ncbi:thioesterase domain-containing protein [Pseudomonas donghuensis]|uniref:thioesterase domain-containing protein n=1 Tax=Pseudomonas donghuensis TaxID=1163398 RepID=UPI002E12F831|nr:thioesterase domain-containing protein [Pseudomonas donghuensis]
MHAPTLQRRTVPGSAQPPQVRLICLACSEDHLSQYRAWAAELNEHIELVTVNVLAYGDLTTSLPLQNKCALVASLVERLQVYLRNPHALFGQGPGAQLAFALANHAAQLHPGQTRHLFVSTCDSPHATTAGESVAALNVPVTALYPSGYLARMLGWHDFSSREIELIELPEEQGNEPMFNQRLLQIINTHLGLLSL